jgi:hypothetical protein
LRIPIPHQANEIIAICVGDSVLVEFWPSNAEGRDRADRESVAVGERRQAGTNAGSLHVRTAATSNID